MKYQTICSRLESKERKRAELDMEIVQLRQQKLHMEHLEELKRLREQSKQSLAQAQDNGEEDNRHEK